MPLLGARFGGGVMTEIACDEWMGASPVYGRRLREGLGIPGDGVSAILKTLQLDVGFAHRYMDVRYELTDDASGWFWLPFCGAYQDVNTIFRGAEAELVRLCHHMEDPTFDATAMAVNPRARASRTGRRSQPVTWGRPATGACSSTRTRPASSRRSASATSASSRAASFHPRLPHDSARACATRGRVRARLELEAFAHPVLARQCRSSRSMCTC
jgi:hypothetical protein